MLSRRAFLAGTATVSAGLAGAAPALALPPAERQLGALMDRLWDEQLRRFPETATACAEDTGRNAVLRARLDPWSREARADWVDWARSASRRIEAIDAAALPQATLVNRAVLLDHFDKVARLGARYRFGAAASDAFAPVAPYAISPCTGPHRAIPDLLDARHPVAAREDCEAWLERLAAFPRALDATTEAFRSDAAGGVVPPGFTLDAARQQLAALRRAGGEAGALAATLGARAASAGLSGDWDARAAALVARGLQPALDRQIAALDTVRPAAGDAAGVWSLREGEPFYADALAWHTASALTPDEVHALGREQVARRSAELDAVLAGLGLPQGRLTERMAALARAGAQGERAAREPGRLGERVSALFPIAPLSGPDALGVRPTDGPRYLHTTLAFQQDYAGPRWEAAAAAANPALPAIRRRGTRYGAYAEGWTRYAEQVLDEAGFYADDRVSRAGYLQQQVLIAARMVADTGLHARRWSREQAASYLAEATGLPLAAMQAEVDRACVTPGQACAAGVGQAEWLRLRALGQRLAGASFDQRHFHRLILQGRAPFAVLEDVVAATFTRRLSVLVKRSV